MKRGIIFLSALLLSVMGVNVCSREPLTFEERVKAQEAIELVYYNHRIWPKENPQPKPSFEKMVTKEQIEAKVTDYLKKCSALDQFWQRPVIASQLQAEMERMAKGSKDPATLNELFAALNNDPYLIAECLARPVLADRLIHNWYANDDRFHSYTRAKAEKARKELTPENFCGYPEGQYSKMTYRLEVEDREEMEEHPPEDNIIGLDEKEFAKMLAEMPDEGKISTIQENNDSFMIVHTIVRNGGEIEIESLSFQKTGVDEWLKNQDIEAKLPETNASAESLYVPPMPKASCTEGWDNGILDDGPNVCSNYSMIWTGSELILWGTGNVGNKGTGWRFNPDTGVWLPTSTGANCPYYARNGHTSIWTGTEMIIWGGGSLSGGARYNPLNDTWVTMPDGPFARERHTAVWTGTKMIVWGGLYSGGINEYLNTGGVYDPSSNTWVSTSTGANVPAGRAFHSAVWTGTEMIVWGGYSESTMIGNSGGRYNPSSDTWLPTSTGTDCPSERYDHTAVWTGSEMIIWGGQSATTYKQDGGKYDPVSDTWTATSTGTNCPLGRSEQAAFWTSSGMVIWGGRYYSGSYIYLNSGGLYDPSSDTWTATSTGSNCPPVITGYGYHSVWTGTEMIVWQCSSTPGGGKYDPLSDSWTKIADSRYIPSAGYYHKAVWTGSEMIMWPGPSLQSVGTRYNPSTDSWSTVSTGTNSPTVRSGHTAIWTGSEMIVWGGYSGGYSNTGGRYNPTSDTWMATSTGTNCPLGRRYHSAVWTGTEMIVWGGYGGSYLNSGGRYTPASDSWKATSTGTNCPSARNGVGVWTGSEMIIWSGGTGGKYYPASDSWNSVSTGTNCPAGGGWLVWTGSEMITWGGYDSNLYGRCGRYNPSTDSWTAMSNGASVLLGREANTAVWTGTEMVIWGGAIGSTYWNNGGRYNPGTNSWTALSMAGNVPAGRCSHTAVWADSMMIIWGGTDGYGYPSGGGRYFIPYAPSGLSNNTAGDIDLCSDSGVLVSWTAPTNWGDGGTGTRTYDVLRDGSPIATGLSGSTLTYTDTSGVNGTSYLYQVRANNGCGLSTTTTGATAVDNGGFGPSSVANTASDISCIYDGVLIQWAAPSSWLDSGTGTRTFDVIRDGSSIATGLSEATLSYTDTTGSDDVSYLYQIRANNGCGYSTMSAGASAADMGVPNPAISGDSVNTCPASSVSLTADPGYSTYQWKYGGADISGATSSAYGCTLSGSYSVTVKSANGCQGTSSSKTVSISFCSTSEVSPKMAVYPAAMKKDAGSSTGYYIYFQKIDGVDGYNIYEGTLGSWYSHSGQSGNLCAASVTDLGTGEMRAEINPSAGNRYYLVTAYSGGVEGPSGFNSANVEIDPFLNSCGP